MPNRGEPRQQEHPSVSVVEQILAVAVSKSGGNMPLRDGKAIVDRAVWLCACETLDDAPTWLIYDITDGKVDWCRVPDGIDVEHFVDAPLITGAHTAPEYVLSWLQGDESSTAAEDWPFDGEVIEDLGRKIRQLHAG